MIRVVAHRVQPSQPALVRPVAAIERRQVGEPGVRRHDPRRIGEHDAVQVGIRPPVHRIDEGRRVHRDLARVVELELRLEQPARAGIRAEEDELRVLATARIELQRPADVGAQPVVALHAFGQLEQPLDLRREILLGR